MTRVIASIVLWLLPVTITRAVSIVGFGVHAIGRGFGSTRSHAPRRGCPDPRVVAACRFSAGPLVPCTRWARARC